MSPTEKAKELYQKFSFTAKSFIWGKQCAILAVDEIINDNPNIYDSDRLNYKYWQEVKIEIEKL
jgi:hypothetical protein